MENIWLDLAIADWRMTVLYYYYYRLFYKWSGPTRRLQGDRIGRDVEREEGAALAPCLCMGWLAVDSTGVHSVSQSVCQSVRSKHCFHTPGLPGAWHLLLLLLLQNVSLREKQKSFIATLSEDSRAVS